MYKGIFPDTGEKGDCKINKNGKGAFLLSRNMAQ